MRLLQTWRRAVACRRSVTTSTRDRRMSTSNTWLVVGEVGEGEAVLAEV